LYIVHRDQHIQKTFCLNQQDISSTPKMDRAGFSTISVIGYCWPVIAETRVSSRDQSVWDLWWTKQHLDRFFTDYFHFPMLVSFHQCSQTHISFLSHHQCYMIIEADFVSSLCQTTWWHVPEVSIFIFITEQLVQNCPFVKLNVLMEIPDL